MTTHTTEEHEQAEAQPAVMPDNAAAIRLLDEWLADESGYDERVWPVVEKALRENPL